MNLQKSHDFRIDNIRAIAIILVVFAHSVIIYDPGWPHFTSVNESPILRDIKIAFALIHMPVFTFLSGILFCKKPRSITIKKLIKDKSKRELIPYLFFALCWMIPIKLLIGFKPYVNTSLLRLLVRGIALGQDNGHLWYCQFIFCAFIATFLLYRLFRACMKHIDCHSADLLDTCIYIVILVFSMFLYSIRNSSILNVPAISRLVKRFCANYVWFCFGSFAGSYLYKKRLPVSLYSCVRYGSIIAFCVLVYYYFQGSTYLAGLIGLIGILMIYTIMPTKPVQVLSAISKNSFGIYLIHSPFVYITFTYFPDIAPGLILLINFVLFGCVSYFATELLRKTRLRFVLGE